MSQPRENVYIPVSFEDDYIRVVGERDRALYDAAIGRGRVAALELKLSTARANCAKLAWSAAIATLVAAWALAMLCFR